MAARLAVIQHGERKCLAIFSISGWCCEHGRWAEYALQEEPKPVTSVGSNG